MASVPELTGCHTQARQDTNRNFKDMAEKYGDISKELKEFRKTVKGFLEAFLSEYQKRTTNP